MKRIFSLAAVALLAAQPIYAQSAGVNATRAAAELKHVGACLYSKYRGQSVALLASPPGTPAEASLVGSARSHFNDCLSSDVAGINPDVTELRGAIAEAAYRGTYASDPDFSKLDHAPQPLPAAWTSAKVDPTVLVGPDFAQCVVAADPQNAAALTRTEPRTPEEKAVIRGLAPSLGPCVVKDSKLTLDPTFLRALLSQALYRSVPAWQPATAMKKN
jgi:hypothetical protein